MSSLPEPVLLTFVYSDQIVVYRLENDHEVADECDLYADEVYTGNDPDRPELPIHPNCKCYWEDYETGDILGQEF